MEKQDQPRLPEYWMRGAVPGVPPLLQPVAHALLQAEEEIRDLMHNFPEERLWEKPAGKASPAFHLQHISGVLDRLFTYSRLLPLSHEQLKYLSEEGLQLGNITVNQLVNNVSEQIRKSVDHLRTVDASALTEFRGVGRRQLPSTVMGLLFHAAEHTMRHLGQLLVTVAVLRNQ